MFSNPIEQEKLGEGPQSGQITAEAPALIFLVRLIGWAEAICKVACDTGQS